MRVLHVLDHSIPLHSGYTFRTRAILEQQRARGWETFHVTSPKHNFAAHCDIGSESVDGFEFYRSRTPRGLMSKIPVINQWAVISSLQDRLNEIIGDIQPDVIHAHSPALNGVAASRVARQHNIPFVYEIRAFWEDAAVDHGTSREYGLRYKLTRAMETHVVRSANAVTTICEGLRSDLVSRGIQAEKITVIPNAVDIARFSMNHPRDTGLSARLGLEGKVVLGFIGSFYAYEGLSLLLDALSVLRNHRDDVVVLLVGGGPEEGRLKEQAKNLSLGDSVIFTGRVPHAEVENYYSLVDLLVYPRQSMRLTELVTPLKPLEAMAQGHLLVASDVGGHKELIRNGDTGQLFRAGDVDSLVNAVLSMLENKDDWERRRQAGRHFVEAERNWEKSVSNYVHVYDYARKALR